MVKLVSNNDDREVIRNRVGRRLSREVRELTANLMRITRGAGKPEEIEDQARRVAAAAAAYREAGGDGLPVDALSVDPRAAEFAADLAAAELAWCAARNKIIAGALQVVASRLLRQQTHVGRGELEMHDGIKAREAVIEARRTAQKTRV